MITLTETHLCSFTFEVSRVMINSKYIESKVKVFVTTKMLKHLYDKRPAEKYDSILNNIYTFVKYPDHIYINKDSKRGDKLFVMKIEDQNWIVSLESLEEKYYVVTCFKQRGENYLNNYTLIWSWKGDNPSS